MYIYLLSVVALFVASFALKKIFPELCSICFAVSLTWVGGLVLYLLGSVSSAVDGTALAILMGSSATGFMYYLGSRLPERMHIFKLPYLLAAFVLVYSVLVEADYKAFLIVLIVWVVFIVVYIARDRGSKNWFKKLVECCRNW